MGEPRAASLGILMGSIIIGGSIWLGAKKIAAPREDMNGLAKAGDEIAESGRRIAGSLERLSSRLPDWGSDEEEHDETISKTSGAAAKTME